MPQMLTWICKYSPTILGLLKGFFGRSWKFITKEKANKYKESRSKANRKHKYNIVKENGKDRLLDATLSARRYSHHFPVDFS